MEEIKIWAIDGSQVEDLKPVSGMQSEKLLEDTLVNSPEDLEDMAEIDRVRESGEEYVPWERAKIELRADGVGV